MISSSYVFGAGTWENQTYHNFANHNECKFGEPCVVFSSDSHFNMTLFWNDSHLKIFRKHPWIHLKIFWNDSPHFEITSPTTGNKI